MSEPNERAEERTEWAESRTDWAEDRTSLANERTFAGWMRTGLASLAVAIGLKAVFGAFEPTWMAKSVATIFVGTAVLIFIAAAVQSRKTQKRITPHDAQSQSHQRMAVLAALMSIGSICTGAILWWL